MEQFMNELEFLLWDPTPAIKTYTLSSTASQKAVQRTKGEGAKKREVKMQQTRWAMTYNTV